MAANPGYSVRPDPSRGVWGNGAAKWGRLTINDDSSVGEQLVQLDSDGRVQISSLRRLGLAAPQLRGEQSEAKYWSRRQWGDPSGYRAHQKDLATRQPAE